MYHAYSFRQNFAERYAKKTHIYKDNLISMIAIGELKPT